MPPIYIYHKQREQSKHSVLPPVILTVPLGNKIAPLTSSKKQVALQQILDTDSTSAVVVFLFLAGQWFTEAILNGPNFHQKLTLVAPTIGYSVSFCVLC